MIELIGALAPWVLAIALGAVVYYQRKLVGLKDEEIEAKNEMIDRLESWASGQATRILILNKLACCGCGHPLGRHDDPDSADGYGCRDCNCQAVHNLVDELERDSRVRKAP